MQQWRLLEGPRVNGLLFFGLMGISYTAETLHFVGVIPAASRLLAVIDAKLSMEAAGLDSHKKIKMQKIRRRHKGDFDLDELTAIPKKPLFGSHFLHFPAIFRRLRRH